MLQGSVGKFLETGILGGGLDPRYSLPSSSGSQDFFHQQVLSKFVIL